MSFNLWSDEDRLFIPRTLGWSINFKYIARKFGWIKPAIKVSTTVDPEVGEQPPATAEDRLARSVERSRYEDN